MHEFSDIEGFWVVEVSREVATEIARQEVERLASRAGDVFEILPESTKELEVGWLFFYSSSDFVATRNPVYALAGNGPLLVLRDGKLRHFPSSVPWEQGLNQI